MKCVVKVLLVLLVLFLSMGRRVPGEGPAGWRLDDFEDGNLTAEAGLSWILIADDLAGGASEARIEVGPKGAAGSLHSLRLAGRLDGSRAWPFAGAWLPLDRSGRNVDLRAFQGVRLRVKCATRLQVGFRAGMVNFMADVEGGSSWRLVEVPFASLAPLGKVPDGTRWIGDSVGTFGVTTPQLPRGEERPAGEVGFEVDDVALYGGGAGAAPVPAEGSAAGFSIVPFTPAASIPSTGWTDLAEDPARDGNTPALPDATRLEAIPSSSDGLVWVRVTLREPPHDRWIGMNLVLDVDGDPENGRPWWGGNSAFRFDRLVSVWCIRVAQGCQGQIGVADADQVAAGTFVAGDPGQVRFAIDRERRAFVMGVPREALRPGRSPLRLVAAVGSALLYADDVPSQGAVLLR